MPHKRQDTIWAAKPHTIAKIKLLSAYLYPWFTILGTTRRHQTIVYVDGFCGPGEYENYPIGSPIAAMEAARRARADAGTAWIAGGVHFVCIDEHPKRIEHLRKKVIKDVFLDPAHVSVSYYAKRFDTGIEETRAQFPAAFEGKDPLFVFIDPFGATGVPFEKVARLLSSESSEVLINLDADGIARIMQAGSAANSDEVLRDIFGETAPLDIDPHQNFSGKCRQILHHYKKKLRQYADYVFSFEMRGAADSLNYYLVFASNHPLGLKKRKEAMQQIDNSREYAFRDADERQARLFRFDHPGEWIEKMFGQWKGLRVKWGQVERDVLNETPFVSASRLLKPMEENGYIAEVETVPGVKRRRGTFPEQSVVAVRFEPERIPKSFW